MPDSSVNNVSTGAVLDLSTIDISYWKNRSALLYIFAAAVPSFYIAPLFLALVVIFAAFETLCGRNPTARSAVFFPTACLFLYIVLLGLASRVPLSELLSYQAIRYDANIFYSLLPMLALGSGSLNVATIDRWLKASAIFGSLAYIALPIAGVHSFESHNAAGGYFMVIAAYLVGRSLTSGTKGRRLAIALAMAALFLSDSRGSMLGLIAAVIWLFSFRKLPRLTVFATCTALFVLVVGLLLAHRWWVDNGSVYLYDYADFGPATEDLSLDAFAYGGRPGTFLHRALFLYPMAVDMFLKSPIFGIGFTRFDDFPHFYWGVAGLISFNVTDAISHSNMHAHNSYLHILAEMGLVGLWLMYRLLKSIFKAFAQSEFGPVVGVLLGSLLIASFTEHRLTTPSQAAPTFIILALFWCARRAKAS